ncbi:radical SAM protein [Methanococcoides methylutens]|uniref:Anaerobic ribonucleoside-triphosphate reductase activating protein n=1 Tax=Methanococcoides methylutens MM1 TaxID=1434104 RepID=A0A0E3SSA7_METMT|nr:radical SAM protein [Methanococcoides methylutens]AKB85242.1 anaerobic ribonucleoside-triphosphate reductase activating protein [Methanococcoides methylutens MM1]
MKPKFLNRYFRVEKNELPARFRITKSIPVDFDPSASVEDLWEIHGREIWKYRELLESIDSKGKNIELPEATPSLLDLKIEIAERILENCHICERRCGVNRREGEKGFCRLLETSRYASEFLHMGEEPELVPSHTIFFTGCVFACVFCQNWDISTRPDSGFVADPKNLAGIIEMRRLEGSRNLNFVTPTPHAHSVLKIINRTTVNVPMVWNSNMYHSAEVAKLLEGVIDVYLTDFKYGNDECARKYSKVKDYLSVVKRNHELAYQDSEVIIRHLVMPGHLECCTRPIAEWVANYIPEVRFNLMFQYSPYFRASEYPEIDRRLTSSEKRRAIEIVEKAGLEDVLI